jgi:hypothetical protein
MQLIVFRYIPVPVTTDTQLTGTGAYLIVFLHKSSFEHLRITITVTHEFEFVGSGFMKRVRNQ